MKTKLILEAVLVAGVGIVLVVKYQTLSRERRENAALRQQFEQLSAQAQAHSRPARPAAEARGPVTDSGELDRLRREVGVPGEPPNQLAKLRAENRQLHAATGEPVDPAEVTFQKESEHRSTHLKQWGLLFHVYASKVNDQAPDGFDRVADQIPEQDRAAFLDFATNNFEVMYQGKLAEIHRPGETILFREKQPRRSPKGEWVKVYGFADGSVQLHAETDEASFDAWEKPRLMKAE